MEIYKKLLKIQKAVKGLSKDKKSHNYDYVTGNKLLSFIKPLMDEQGLILKQEITLIENERQDYKVWDKWAKPEPCWKPKAEILSKVMMRFTWIDCETGETDVNMFGANGQNDWEKGLGSALTYGERYFLLKYFHIATDEDDIDNPNRKPEEVKQKNEAIELPWLTRMNGKEISQNWKRVLSTLRAGKDMNYIESKFKITNENKQLLLIESKKE